MTSINQVPTDMPHARRNDIDVLRAIAVLAVTLYHFDVPLLSGGLFQAGFLGVDIFFVISGYLITKQILAHINTDSFSLLNFYAKRIRRLLPAFLIVLIATALVSLWLMTPSQLERFNGSLTYTSLYISNFFFWQESGYFDSSSITKPLLHTWSLSVEEQFYLFWPIFLLLFFNRKIWLWMFGLFLLSLGAVEFLIEKHSSPVFYLMPFRIFEFAIGGLLIPFANRAKALNHRNTLSIICLIVIFLSFSLITHDHFIPSVIVLPTLLATAMIIAMQSTALQSSNPLINNAAWIGRISYSMYLVHWPLVVFYRMQFGEQLDFIDVGILLLATIVLTLLLYYCIELPTQKIQLQPLRWLLLLPCGLIVALLFSTLGNDFYKTLRHDREQIDNLLKTIPERNDEVNIFRKLMPEHTKGTRVMIMGDSHVLDMRLGLMLADAPPMIFRSQGKYCDPLLLNISDDEIKEHYKSHPARHAHPYDCVKYHKTMLWSIKRFDPDVIIFSERWRNEALPYAEQTFAYLRSEMGINVIVFGKNQEFYQTPDRILAKAAKLEEINQIAWQMRKDDSGINTKLKEIADAAGVTYIDKSKFVCLTQDHCDYVYNGKLTYSDSNHWTSTGMKLFAQRIVDSQEFRSAWDTEHTTRLKYTKE